MGHRNKTTQKTSREDSLDVFVLRPLSRRENFFMISLFSRFKPLGRTVARLLLPTILLGLIVVISPYAHAWSAVGHMTIGAIAEPRLNDNARREVNKLLPLVADPRTPNFMTAGVWMDDIRADEVRLFDRWHYDNLGHSPDGTPTGPRHPDNVAWAVAQNVEALKSPKASNEEKARSLRFLLHTAQDAHNPLHCGSRFTKEFPEGDSGGNKFLLKKENEESPGNLHSLWDRAFGTFQSDGQPRLQNENRLRALALALTAKYPEASLPQSVVLDPEIWVKEGSAILSSGIYPPSDTPDAAYIGRFRPIAEKQATLAGYRLARLLNTIWP